MPDPIPDDDRPVAERLAAATARLAELHQEADEYREAVRAANVRHQDARQAIDSQRAHVEELLRELDPSLVEAWREKGEA